MLANEDIKIPCNEIGQNDSINMSLFGLNQCFVSDVCGNCQFRLNFN